MLHVEREEKLIPNPVGSSTQNEEHIIDLILLSLALIIEVPISGR
jgi:hypothetical protein